MVSSTHEQSRFSIIQVDTIDLTLKFCSTAAPIAGMNDWGGFKAYQYVKKGEKLV